MTLGLHDRRWFKAMPRVAHGHASDFIPSYFKECKTGRMAKADVKIEKSDTSREGYLLLLFS